MARENVVFIKGLNPVGALKRPDWISSNLHLWYFILRVEKPRSTKRRQLYRNIEGEKLRLAELGINQELIKATCRYLSCYSVVAGNKMIDLMDRVDVQMCFDFTRKGDF